MAAVPVFDAETAELTRFVGRERELAALKSVLSQARLVTLTGAGGSGKTRLARELIPPIDTIAPNGALWVELAGLDDPQLIPQQIAEVMELRELGARTPINAVIEELRGRQSLLVLDNCEHLVEASAEVATALLSRCPQLRILATSREALSVKGERAWLVPGLALPADQASTEQISQSEAVQLFVERARDVLPDFSITDANANAVSEICRQLDGIPLAIELAAARVRVLSPEQIRARLGNALALLTSGGRTTVHRHRTLRAAIDWSHELLPDAARILLRRLSVFRGGFTLDAVETVGIGRGVAADEILDLLSQLVDRSLVTLRETDAGGRYFLLETVRQHAAEQLVASGEEQRVRADFAAFIAAEIEVTHPDFFTARRKAAVQRVHAEIDNIRDVLNWTRDHDKDLHIHLVGRLWLYWYSAQQWIEARRWQEEALQMPEAQAPTLSRARLLFAEGALAALQTRSAAARTLLVEGAALAGQLGDQRLQSYIHNYLGIAYVQSAEPGGRAILEQSVRWFREHHDPYGLRLALVLIGFIEVNEGRHEAAVQVYNEAVDIARSFGQDRELAIALVSLATVYIDEQPALAEPVLLEALASLKRDPAHLFLARALELLAIVAGSAAPEEAALRLGAGEAVRARVGATRMPIDQKRVQRCFDSVREALGQSAFDQHFSRGRALSPEAALEHMLASAPAVTKPSAITLTVQSLAADLQVRALGPLEILRQGQLIADWAYAKPRELLVFLLGQERGRTRQQITAALWPGATPAQSKNSFHVTMHHLRKALGQADWIVLEEGRYRSARTLSVAYDVRDFERLVERGERDGALALYRGDFLAGEPIGEWHEEQRDALRRDYLGLLMDQGTQLEQEGATDRAIEIYQAVVQQEELNEEAHRRLMSAWVRAGDRPRALKHYERMVARLRDDFGMDAEPETHELQARIRAAIPV